MSMQSAQRDWDAQRPTDQPCKCSDDCHCGMVDAGLDCRCCDQCVCSRDIDEDSCWDAA